MAAKRQTHHREDFIDAGLAFVKSRSVSELTVRSLAAEMGVSSAVMYAHFPSMEALYSAILDAFYSEIQLLEIVGTTPRERLESFMGNVSTTYHRYPQLVLLSAGSNGLEPNGLALSRTALRLLRDLGLGDDDVVVCYQALESFLVGSHVFDLSGAPDHLVIRRTRYRAIDEPVLDRSVPDVVHMGEVNRAAFALGLSALLDRFDDMAKHAGV